MKSADLEHIWMPPEKLPSSLRKFFKQGVCAVFANEELTAAIPATNDETEELADLMEMASISRPVTEEGMRPYQELRDKLCEPFHYVQLTAWFKSEMDLERNREDKLACAARWN